MNINDKILSVWLIETNCYASQSNRFYTKVGPTKPLEIIVQFNLESLLIKQS